MQSAPCTNVGADRAHVVDRVLAGEHHALDAEPPHHARAALVVHRHLGGAVDLERRVDAADEAHEPHVLHDHRVDPAVHRLAEELEGVGELRRLHEHVEREVDPHPAAVRELAGPLELVERELGAVVARVEALGAQVDGVGAVGDRGAHGVEGARRGEQLGEETADHKPCKITV
jgi:hypothetical protein